MSAAPIERPILETSTITRMRMIAAMELANDSELVDTMRSSWFGAVPLDATARFGLLLSADGKRRRWLVEASADSYVPSLVSWLRDGGIDADERATMLRFGKSFGRNRIGAWFEEQDGRFATGWRVAPEVPIESAFELARPSDDARALREWTVREGIVHAREVMRTVGDEQQTQWTMSASLEAIERAFVALRLAYPSELVAHTIGYFPPTSFGLTITLGPNDAEHIGIVSVRPQRQLVLATCDLVGPECDARLAAYEIALGVKRPESVELSIGDIVDAKIHLVGVQ